MNFKNGIPLDQNDGQAYGWSQTVNDLTVIFPFDHDIKLKEFEFNVKPTSISIRKKSAPSGEYLINGQFFKPIKMDNASWQVDGSKNLLLELEKRNRSEWWDSLIIGHKKVDSSKLEPESTTDISDLDDETQTMVRKMMFDNQQRQQGLPTSDELEKQKLLKNFAQQHPEFDFSKAKIQ